MLTICPGQINISHIYFDFQVFWGFMTSLYWDQKTKKNKYTYKTVSYDEMFSKINTENRFETGTQESYTHWNGAN